MSTIVLAVLLAAIPHGPNNPIDWSVITFPPLGREATVAVIEALPAVPFDRGITEERICWLLEEMANRDSSGAPWRLELLDGWCTRVRHGGLSWFSWWRTADIVRMAVLDGRDIHPDIARVYREMVEVLGPWLDYVGSNLPYVGSKMERR